MSTPAPIEAATLARLVFEHQPAHVEHEQVATGDTEASCSCGAMLALPRTDRVPQQLSGAAIIHVRPKHG